MKLTKLIQCIVLVPLVIGTSLAGWTFINRLRLEYNFEGRYFDEANSVVYHQQAVVIYGLVFVILLFIVIGVIYRVRKAGS